MDTSEQRVQLRSYARKVSNTSRYSYVEAVGLGREGWKVYTDLIAVIVDRCCECDCVFLVL